MTLWQFLRGLGGREAGRSGRSCGVAVRRDDHFGTGERVSRPCRTASP
jgi:hypothetical protein